MRKKVAAIIITALCLSACGNTADVSSESSNAVSTANETADAVPDMSETTADVSDMSASANAVPDSNASSVAEGISDKTSAEDFESALSEKYADIYRCLENSDYDSAKDYIKRMKPEATYENLYRSLENEDYDKALRIIEAMKSEQPTETIPLTVDNWSTYFEVKGNPSHSTYDLDANGNIKRSVYQLDLQLKPEYAEKLVSVSGTVGYEYGDYVPHIVTNIDETTGSYETERVESGPGDEYVFHNTVSRSSQIDYTGKVSNIADSMVFAENGNTYGDISVTIYNSDQAGTQYIYYPEDINVISVDGELVLRK